MEVNGYHRKNGKGNIEEEESSLLKRLIALQSMYGLLQFTFLLLICVNT